MRDKVSIGLGVSVIGMALMIACAFVALAIAVEATGIIDIIMCFLVIVIGIVCGMAVATKGLKLLIRSK